MFAAFDDFAVAEDEDFVGFADGAQAVGDDDGRAAFGELFEGGCFVEDEDGRVDDEGAGEGEELALAYGEGAAALVEHVVEGAIEAFDDLVGADGAEAFPDAVVADVDAECDVFADGAGEDDDVLGDEGGAGSEAVEGEVADVAAVDADGALGGVVEAADEVDDGGFTGAGVADEGEHLAGLEVEVDAAQDVVGLAGVSEAYAFEGDAALGDGERGVGGLGVGHGGRGVEDVHDALAGRE